MPPQAPQQQYSVSHSSQTPLISSDQPESSQVEADSGEDGGEERDPKTGKRRFFGLGKKKDDKKDMASSNTGKMSPPPAIGTMRPPSPGKQDSSLRAHPQPIPISPNRQSTYAASPSRMRSSSPRLHSPASSEIVRMPMGKEVQVLRGFETTQCLRGYADKY